MSQEFGQGVTRKFVTKGGSWIRSQTRKNQPVNFKAKVAVTAFREEVRISELASTYGVHTRVNYRWKRKAIASLQAGFFGKLAKATTDQDAHFHELHDKMGQLSVEQNF